MTVAIPVIIVFGILAAITLITNRISRATERTETGRGKIGLYG